MKFPSRTWFEVDRFYRLVLSVVVVVALVVLMLTDTIDHEDGLLPILYLIGYGVGGTYGPKVTKLNGNEAEHR